MAADEGSCYAKFSGEILLCCQVELQPGLAVVAFEADRERSVGLDFKRNFQRVGHWDFFHRVRKGGVEVEGPRTADRLIVERFQGELYVVQGALLPEKPRAEIAG